MSNLKTCGQCALKAIRGGICPIFNREMEDDEPGCPIYSISITQCELCGNPIIEGGVIEDNHIICNNCANLPACHICVNMKECLFQTDQSCPEPQMISVQQQQGPMVIQTQTVNPKRVQLTCAKGCPCFFEEGAAKGSFCWRQFKCACSKFVPDWKN